MNANDLEWLAARLLIAVYDTNRESEAMSVQALKSALADIPGSQELTINYAPNGNQLITIDGKTLEVGPMASNDEIRLALQNPFVRTENTKMAITDAGKLATSIKDRIQAAKDRVAAVSANTDNALKKLNDAADTGDKIAKQIEAEADDLHAQLGQFSNGGPA